MTELVAPAIAAVVGGLIGFALRWSLQERKEQYEMRRSIAPMRVEAYRGLWSLCDKNISDEERTARADALWAWYSSGGGLFLSLGASTHFFAALKLLREVALDPDAVGNLQTQLTWIRTEMKYHLGSYTLEEAHTQIPDAERPKRSFARPWARSTFKRGRW